MNLFKSKLEKATATFEELTKVNKDIEEINAYAQALVNGEIKSQIHLIGEKPKKEKEEPQLKEDESPIFFIQRFFREKAESSSNDLRISHELNEKLSLEVLGVLVKAKEKYKESLVKQLKKYGLKV